MTYQIFDVCKAVSDDVGMVIQIGDKRQAPHGKLYYGDNLDILRGGRIQDESVDLVYLDPPFNSSRAYNVIFREDDQSEPDAQVQAFSDYWKWDQAAERTFREMTQAAGAVRPVSDRLSSLIESFRRFLGDTNMAAYLVMMAPRLVELHRVLKSTGSLYLHCDPTASHYLKILLDAIFGPECFRNEIIWRRTGAHTPPKKFGPVHDTILFYTKHPTDYFFNVIRAPYMLGHVENRYTKDQAGRYKFTSGGNILTGSGIRDGESGQPWKGFGPTAKRRHWAIPGFLAEQMPVDFAKLGVIQKLDALYEAGLVEISPGAAWPIPVRYLGENDGNPISDIWAYQPYTEGTVYGADDGIDADVQWLGPSSPERTGYATQKPLGLLDRIIKTSCPKNGVVLDPFCGCGTAIEAAEVRERHWIGIDITYLAIPIIRSRLIGLQKSCYEIYGVPADMKSAQQLADSDQYQFQWWALDVVGAFPVKTVVPMSREGAKGADRGVDGVIKFREDASTPVSKRIIVSVKAGKHLAPSMIRDLRGTIDREEAPIGVLVTMHEPSVQMRHEAMDAGVYTPAGWNKSYQRIQILTVKQIFEGTKVDFPGFNVTSPEARSGQLSLFDSPTTKKSASRTKDLRPLTTAASRGVSPKRARTSRG